MKTGKAYAFLNYEGRWTELAEDLGVSRGMANFPDTFRFSQYFYSGNGKILFIPHNLLHLFARTKWSGNF